ncbi:hypothetical protein ACVIJ6_001510 [Bradyrhizobium sp. USDA 4369]
MVLARARNRLLSREWSRRRVTAGLRGMGWQRRCGSSAPSSQLRRHRPSNRAIQYAAMAVRNGAAAAYWIPTCAGMTSVLVASSRAAFETAQRKHKSFLRHCERSDLSAIARRATAEAIQAAGGTLDCFVAALLAMTRRGRALRRQSHHGKARGGGGGAPSRKAQSCILAARSAPELCVNSPSGCGERREGRTSTEARGPRANKNARGRNHRFSRSDPAFPARWSSHL